MIRGALPGCMTSSPALLSCARDRCQQPVEYEGAREESAAPGKRLLLEEAGREGSAGNIWLRGPMPGSPMAARCSCHYIPIGIREELLCSRGEMCHLQNISHG